jgi:hypothetical protein
MKFATELLPRVGSFVVVALFLAPALHAQQNSGRNARTDILQQELRRQSEREMLERAMTEAPKENRRTPNIALAEFKTDFLGLQVVSNRLMNAVAGGAALDLNLVGKSTAEIGKVARRLKANLALPKPIESPARQQATSELGFEQLRPSLLALDQLIVAFVSNPVFESAKVVDAELSAKARRDLDQIIELSGELKKGSERLRQGQ